MRNFLGLIGYYRRFVQGFFTIVVPLPKLMRKNVSFVWTKECKANFQELKKQLTTAPILTLITRNGGFVIFTDAPNISLRCVLLQDGNVVPLLLKTIEGTRLKVCDRSPGVGSSNVRTKDMKALV